MSPKTAKILAVLIFLIIHMLGLYELFIEGEKYQATGQISHVTYWIIVAMTFLGSWLSFCLRSK